VVELNRLIVGENKYT